MQCLHNTVHNAWNLDTHTDTHTHTVYNLQLAHTTYDIIQHILQLLINKGNVNMHYIFRTYTVIYNLFEMLNSIENLELD